MPRSLKRNRWLALIGIVAFSITLSLHCSRAEAKVVERIIAVINGDIITQTDLEAKLRQEGFSEERAAGPIQKEQKRSNALNRLIDEILLKQAIEHSNIQITEEELDRAINNILQQNRMTKSQLRTEVAKKGITFEEYKEQLKLEIKKIKFVNQVISSGVKVTDRDLRDYFDRNKATFRGGKQAHIAEIVLPITDITTEEEAIALRNKALSIVKQSRDRPSAFSKLAKQHSQGPNANKGGDIGVVKIDDLPTNVAQVVKNMPAGAVSNPIPTEMAIVIVKLIQWPEVSDQDFDSMRDIIYQRLHDQKMEGALESYVQKMRQHAYIEIR